MYVVMFSVVLTCACVCACPATWAVFAFTESVLGNHV